MQLSKITSFFSSSPKLTSQTPPSNKTSAAVGASAAEPIETHFLNHEHLLKWIHETKHKLPHATPKLRQEAFEADPLLSGTIYPYLKNTLLQGFTVQTKDNKLYSQAIEEITDWLEYIQLMQVFRDDYKDFGILVGHSYRRIDRDLEKKINHLEKITPSTVQTYTDPWDSSITFYHQKARVNKSFSSMGTYEEVDSWFIPYGNLDNYETYIDKRETGNNEAVKVLFEKYKIDYNISDINNLRIAAAERILAMHNTDVKQVHNYYDDDEYKQDHAPIDSIILAIWLKRLLLVNAPNLIYAIISPFIHVKNGMIQIGKDMTGNPVFITSTPRKPTEGSFNYAAEIANYNAYIASMQTLSDNVTKSMKSGGSLTTAPDVTLEPVESAKSVSDSFIKMLIDQLDEEIGQAFGVPMALISANGSELATSRTILQMFNTVHAGDRREYEATADRLIKLMFSDRTWQGITIEDDKEVTVSYSFEDIKAHFVLDTPDTKDLLIEAQTLKTKAETLSQIKSVGACKDDVQALGEEYGFGLLGLDNYDVQESSQMEFTEDSMKQVNAILKSLIYGAMQEEGLISASPTDPSGFKERELVKKLQDAYTEGLETIFDHED